MTEFTGSSIEDWDDYIYENKSEDNVGNYYITSYSASAVEYTLEINSLYRDALPLYQNEMS